MHGAAGGLAGCDQFLCGTGAGQVFYCRNGCNFRGIFRRRKLDLLISTQTLTFRADILYASSN